MNFTDFPFDVFHREGFSVRCLLAVQCLLFACLPICTCSGQMIVAHRGASYDAPENTLAAFQLAWQRGADGIEGDFYLSKDGEIVCIHDKTTKRLAPNQPELKVSESTLEQLRQLDVGSWKDAKYAGEKIPTLKEVLSTVPPGKRILVEIKCGPEIVPTLKEQLAASKLEADQIIIIAFSEAVVKSCRESMPKYKCNWLTSFEQENEASPWTPAKKDVIASLKRTKATGLGSQGNESVLVKSFIDSVRAADCEMHVWTVNDPDAAQRLAKLGVDSITTDRPALIRKALR